MQPVSLKVNSEISLLELNRLEFEQIDCGFCSGKLQVDTVPITLRFHPNVLVSLSQWFVAAIRVVVKKAPIYIWLPHLLQLQHPPCPGALRSS